MGNVESSSDNIYNFEGSKLANEENGDGNVSFIDYLIFLIIDARRINNYIQLSTRCNIIHMRGLVTNNIAEILLIYCIGYKVYK